MTLQQQLPPSRRECSAIPTGDKKLILGGPGRLIFLLTDTTEMVIFNRGLKDEGQENIYIFHPFIQQ